MKINDIKKDAYVVYGTNGICLVDDVTEMAFLGGGDKKLYFILRPISDRSSVIYIPHDNDALLARVRPILSHEEAEFLLNTPNIGETAWIADRKQRALAFREILQEGNPREMLTLIKCICLWRDSLTEQNKKLSNADREALSAAFKAVCNELAFALSLPCDEVEEKLQATLNVSI